MTELFFIFAINSEMVIFTITACAVAKQRLKISEGTGGSTACFEGNDPPTSNPQVFKDALRMTSLSNIPGSGFTVKLLDNIISMTSLSEPSQSPVFVFTQQPPSANNTLEQTIIKNAVAWGIKVKFVQLLFNFKYALCTF
jgi:hypothetical protein